MGGEKHYLLPFVVQGFRYPVLWLHVFPGNYETHVFMGVPLDTLDTISRLM